MHVKGYYPGSWCTELQLKKKGLIPKENATSTSMWSNPYCNQVYEYYLIEDSREMTAQELEEFKQSERKKRRIYDRLRRYKKRRIKNFEENSSFSSQCHLELSDLKNRDLSGLLVYDTETTGLDPIENAIVELAIVNLSGETLYHSYFNPPEQAVWNSVAWSMSKDHMDEIENAPHIRRRARKHSKCS